jgi:hypothetical protein
MAIIDFSVKVGKNEERRIRNRVKTARKVEC